jgi:hypothetical protein
VDDPVATLRGVIRTGQIQPMTPLVGGSLT